MQWLKEPPRLSPEWERFLTFVRDSVLPALAKFAAEFEAWFYRPLSESPADPAVTAPAPEKRARRGPKIIKEDHSRLIMMAQFIDAGFAERPTLAVRLLPEFQDIKEHARDQFIDRLVGKFNDPAMFQQELALLRQTPDWRETIERLRKSRATGH
jgi:hypothetical protein